MTDRDRLIELFNVIEKDPAVTCPHKTDKTCDTCKYTINNFMCNHTERTVDYLLANGVIVPPCKVGDTVYYPWIYDGQCGVAFSEVESIKIYVNGLPLVIVEDWESDMPMPISFYSEDFGKTVFFTKEEAEEKLKELKGDA